MLNCIQFDGKTYRPFPVTISIKKGTWFNWFATSEYQNQRYVLDEDFSFQCVGATPSRYVLYSGKTVKLHRANVSGTSTESLHMMYGLIEKDSKAITNVKWGGVAPPLHLSCLQVRDTSSRRMK